jgi:hypothetical protein
MSSLVTTVLHSTVLRYSYFLFRYSLAPFPVSSMKFLPTFYYSTSPVLRRTTRVLVRSQRKLGLEQPFLLLVQQRDWL